MRNPETLAGRVWIEKYFASLQTFMLSQRRDGEALKDAARHLGHALQREPGYAREARQLAVQCSSGCYNAGHPDVLSDLVKVGLDAEVMSPDLALEPAPTILLMLYQAEAQLLDGRRLDGLATLDRIAERLGPEPPDDPLLEFVRAREALIRAELDELDREFERSRRRFQESRVLAHSLLEDEDKRNAITDAYVAQVFGPKDATISSHIEGLISYFFLLLEQTYIGAILGCLRSTPPGDEDLPDIANELMRAVDQHGLVKGSSPFLVAEAVVGLPPVLVETLGQHLSEAASSAMSALFDKGLLDGLDPSMAEQVIAMAEQSDERARRERANWEIAMGIAYARSVEASSEEVSAAVELYRTVVHSAIMSQDVGALAKAYALGAYVAFLARGSSEADEIAEMIDMFLVVFGGTIAGEPEVFEDARYRALFDEPIAAMITWALTRPDALDGWKERLWVSVALDLLRSREGPAPDLMMRLVTRERPASPVADGLEYVSNTLERVIEALAGEVGILVLVSHWTGRQHIFLTVNGDGADVFHADERFQKTLDELEEVAARAIFHRAASKSGDDTVEAPAQAAFGALPNRIQEMVRRAEVILVVPDFRWEADVIPYELLHDGNSYLLQSHIVARFTSLRHLARTLDTRVERPSKHRALVTAAPDTVPSQPLYTAMPERDAIRSCLLEIDVDVPEIETHRLSARFFTERLPYIDLFHIAAHGESAAGTEYVLLPGGGRLSVDDLAETNSPSFPFAYLNTCRLARTRFLGGGRAKGLAYTLSELGAPAVVANTTDVLDEISMATATSFYEAAIASPVGTALREARQRVIEDGYPPVLVGRVILFGDPFFELFGEPGESESDFDLASRLLDTYFGELENEDDRALIRRQAELQLLTDQTDHRLQAAIRLLHSLADVEAYSSQTQGLFEEAIVLADALQHAPTQAMLRFIRAQASLQAGSEIGRAWIRDAIDHLRALESRPGPWSHMLLDARAKLRRLELGDKGLEIRHTGPQSEDGDEALDAVMDILIATQQAQEEELGAVELRSREDTLEDIAWNAVVMGHPNRFEDVAEASDISRFFTRKLISRGHLPQEAEAYAPPMFAGLLWFLWSSQKTAYLEPELAQSQAGTLIAMIKDIQANWSPPPEKSWRAKVDQFSEDLDETLAFLEALPWEKVHPAISERIPNLVTEAEEMLSRIAEETPEALAGCAAYVTGMLAVKNTYSPLEGSVPEDVHEKLTDAVWSLNGGNEGRFFPFLLDGFEEVRNRQPDELDRWRMER